MADRRDQVLVALVALLLGTVACVPPHGFGHQVLPGSGRDFSLAGSIEYGYTPNRHVVQVGLASGFDLNDWFGFDLGGLYTALRAPGLFPEQADDASAFAHSGFPYVQATFRAGPVTIAVPVSALPAVGPEAGILFGYGALVVRYDGGPWGAYGALAGHGIQQLSGEGERIGTYWEAGGGAQYEFDFGGFLVGLSSDVFYAEHAYRYQGPQRTQRFVMVMFGLQMGFRDGS